MFHRPNLSVPPGGGGDGTINPSNSTSCSVSDQAGGGGPSSTSLLPLLSGKEDSSITALRKGPRRSLKRKNSKEVLERTGSGLSLSRCVAIILGVVVVSIVFVVSGYNPFTTYQANHDAWLKQRVRGQEVEPSSKEEQVKIEALQADNARLQVQLQAALNAQVDAERQLKEASAGNLGQQQPELLKQLDYLTKYKTKMQANIQKLSKIHLMRKFGAGPHHVEINLAFDPMSNVANESGGDTIIIQLAPVDEMPHTVYWFLEQVDNKLWDGNSFHRNAGHVVQGGPAKNFLTTDSHVNPDRRFEESGFYSVLFQEYSPTFPHRKYTLGYAGRPGGPDFYVSTQDNTRNHGPGGQGSYADPGEADPCFAKVIQGFDAVDRMHKSEVQPGGYKRMSHYVAIVYMRIMTHAEVEELGLT